MEIDNLLCSICGEMLKEPKDLPCKHSFCRLCLMNYCVHNAQVNTFPCPECKKTIPVKEQNRPLVEWADFFPSNYDTIRKLEKMLLLEKKAQEKSCILCTQKWTPTVATKYCKACDEYFCDECGNQHWLLRASKAHRIVLIQQLEEKQNDPLLRATLLAMFNARIKEKKSNNHGPKMTLRGPRVVAPAPLTSSKQDDADCLITGAAFLKDGSVVLIDKENHKLKLFDRNYRFVYSLVTSAWDVMSINDFYFVITCPSERCLKFYNVYDYNIQEQNEVSTEEECYGLCLAGHRIVVACTGEPVTLKIFSSIETMETVELESGKLKLLIPYYVAHDEVKNHFYVSDIQSKCVKCFEESGKIVWEKPIPDGQSIAMYETHLLLARKDQQTVDIMNADGQSLKSVVSSEDGLLHTRTICIETQQEDGPDDRLLVADDTNIVRVFALEDPAKDVDLLKQNIERNKLRKNSTDAPLMLYDRNKRTGVCTIL